MKQAVSAILVTFALALLVSPAFAKAADQCGDVSIAMEDVRSGLGHVKSSSGQEFRADAMLYFEKHRRAFEKELHDLYGDIRYLSAGLVIATGEQISGVSDYTAAAINVARVLRVLSEKDRFRLFSAMTVYDNSAGTPVFAGKSYDNSTGDVDAFMRWSLNAITEKNTFVDANGVETIARLEPEVAQVIAHMWFGEEALLVDLLNNNRHLTRRTDHISGFLQGSCKSAAGSINSLSESTPLRIKLGN